MINIRAATLQDMPVLLNFEQELIAAERPFDETFKEETIHYYNIEEMILSKNVELVIAEEDGSAIACGYASILIPKIYFKFNKFAYVGFMYTKPEHRGKGINKLVMENLFSWIRLQGISEVRLDVYSSNIGAIKAYEKVGFKAHLLKMRMSI